MAKQGWFGSVAFAVGAGAGAAAAQFGLGYGFGVIAWSPEAGAATTADNVWLASLAWTLWIAATSTVVGAVAADRRSAGEIGAAPPRAGRGADVSERPSVFATAMWRALLAVAAAIGALLSVALVLAPADNAGRPDTASPQLIAAGYAVVGVTVGIVLSVCALTARSAAANVMATGVFVWLLAASSVVVDAIRGHGFGSAALEVWPFGNSLYYRHTFSIGGGALMSTAAFAIGLGIAWPAARRGDNRIGVVLSGGAGPLLVAAAYWLTIPNLVGVTDNPQVSASLTAPIAFVAGLAGSGLLVAVVASREASLRERKPRPNLADSGELDTALLRKPTLMAGAAAVPVSAAIKAQAQVKTPAPRSSSESATGSAKAPAPRSAPDETTGRIVTSPKRGSEGVSGKPSAPGSQTGSSGMPTTTGSQPSASGSTPSRSTGPVGNSNKRGRRR
jgi:hypothetical protein